MTLAEIAEKTGVCKATVSLILNGKAKQHHLSDATIRKVESYCRSINYQPNIHAIRMRRKIVGNVMFMLNTCSGTGENNVFSDYNVAQITGGIAHAAREAGCSLSVRFYEPGMDGSQIFNSFRNHEIDGMIYYGVAIPETWIRVFQTEKFKVVGIGIRPQPGLFTVNINNREVSRELTGQLIARGCRKFLYFAGLPASYPGPERYAGFREALKEQKIRFSPESVLPGGFSEATASELMGKYCREHRPQPDAVVCANDAMAIGVIRALQMHGVRVPESVLVAGGDNIALSGYLSPSLTTFDNLAERMGAEAFWMLNDLVNGKAVARDLVLRSPVVKRESA